MLIARRGMTILLVAAILGPVAACGGSVPSPTLAPATPAASSTPQGQTPSAPPTPHASATASAAPSPTPSSRTKVYVVRKGDTLTSIARKLKVTLAALKAANPQIKDPRKMQPGDKITIPLP